MTSDPLGTAIRRLLRRVSAAPSAGLGDAELLERFVRSRDEAAIETLLWRHGPMVLATCRRLMKHQADSEDCFQATFLVLCRRAATIAKRQSVGSWLYKVAYRICLRARAGRSRRPVSAAEVGEPPAAETVSAAEQGELRGVLDEELNRLPERYRAPLVLHYLEEKTVQQIAQELGWRPGTVSSRLARGKELLRARLADRAWALPAAAATAALASATASAAVPPPLARATLQALLTGAGPQPAASLAQDFLRAQLHGRPKWAVALLLAVGTAAVGMGAMLTRDRPGAPDQAGPSNADAESAVEGPRRLDADGDPLPQGAILRLGSARFRGGALMAAYSPDGRVLTTAGGGGIRTWDAVTGRPLQARSHAGLQGPCVLSEDGTLAATQEHGRPFPTHPERITIRRLPGLEVLHTLEDPGKYQARHFCFSRDGRRLAADSRFDILVWDVATGKLTSRLPLRDEKLRVEAMALSPDGALLAAVDSRYDQVIRLWDVAGAREQPPLKVPLTHYLSLAFSGNGEILMAYGTGNCVYLWDANTLAAIRKFSVGGTVPPPVISPSGKVIATTGAENDVRLWNAQTGQLQAVLQEPAEFSRPARFRAGGRPLAFSPDDRSLVVCGSSPQIKVWDVATGHRVRVTDEPDLAASNAPGCYAAISPDGNLIATNRGCTIQLWDARTGPRIVGALEVDSATRDIVFSADGKSLIREPGDVLPVADLLSGTHGADAPWGPPPGRAHGAGSHPGPTLLRGIAAGTAPKAPAGPRAEGTFAALSPDGKTAAWVVHRPSIAISLRDAISGEELHRLPCPGAVAPAFSPDGRGLAVLGKNQVLLWDVASRREVRRFEYAPPQDLLAEWNLHAPLAFSPDGKLVAAACSVDNSIVVWSVPTGHRVGTLRGHGGRVFTLAFTPDSRRLLSGSADTTALMWDVSRLIGGPDDQ